MVCEWKACKRMGSEALRCHIIIITENSHLFLRNKNSKSHTQGIFDDNTKT